MTCRCTLSENGYPWWCDELIDLWNKLRTNPRGNEFSHHITDATRRLDREAMNTPTDLDIDAWAIRSTSPTPEGRDYRLGYRAGAQKMRAVMVNEILSRDPAAKQPPIASQAVTEPKENEALQLEKRTGWAVGEPVPFKSCPLGFFEWKAELYLKTQSLDKGQTSWGTTGTFAGVQVDFAPERMVRPLIEPRPESRFDRFWNENWMGKKWEGDRKAQAKAAWDYALGPR